MIACKPIIEVTGEKGGVTKTTTATHIAIWFAREMGRKTLLVDLDPNRGDCARLLGLKPAPDVFKLFADGEFNPTTTKYDRLDILRGNNRTGVANRIIIDQPAHDTQRVFADAIEPYDLIIVDASPDSGPLRNIISQLAAFFVITTLTDPLGRDELIASVERIQQTGIQYVIVPAKVQDRAHSASVIEGMRKKWGVHVADAIPEREAVRWAAESQIDIWEAAKSGPPQYRKGAQEVATAYEKLGNLIINIGEIALALRG